MLLICKAFPCCECTFSATETRAEISVSLNWSNPLLRWGHTSQPITNNLESGTLPWANQHICAFFLPRSLCSLSFPVSFSFFLKYYFNDPPPEAEVVTICWCVPVSQFLFLLKLLSLYILSLYATPLCATHSFTKYTMLGEIPQPQRQFCTWLCLCLHWTGVYPVYGHLWTFPLWRGCWIKSVRVWVT